MCCWKKKRLILLCKKNSLILRVRLSAHRIPVLHFVPLLHAGGWNEFFPALWSAAQWVRVGLRLPLRGWTRIGAQVDRDWIQGNCLLPSRGAVSSLPHIAFEK